MCVCMHNIVLPSRSAANSDIVTHCGAPMDCTGNLVHVPAGESRNCNASAAGACRLAKLHLSLPQASELPPVGRSESQGTYGKESVDMVMLSSLAVNVLQTSDAAHALLFGRLDLNDSPCNADNAAMAGSGMPEKVGSAGNGGGGEQPSWPHSEPTHQGHGHPSASLLELPAMKSQELGQPGVSLTAVLQLLQRAHLHLQHIWDNGDRGSPHFWSAIALVTSRMLEYSMLLMVSMRLADASRDTGLLELGLALHALVKSEFLAIASDILTSRYCAALDSPLGRSSDGVTQSEMQHRTELHIATGALDFAEVRHRGNCKKLVQGQIVT